MEEYRRYELKEFIENFLGNQELNLQGFFSIEN